MREVLLKTFLVFNVAFFISIVSNAQSSPPVRDTVINVNMCGGIDSSWTCPYFEEGVQYRWEPINVPPLQNFVGHIVSVSAQNISTEILSYEYYMNRTYTDDLGNFIGAFTDTIIFNIYPEASANIPITEFSLCPGDTAQMYYEPLNEGTYVIMNPSFSTSLDTSNSPVHNIFPTEQTFYQAYFTNAGGCLRGPFTIQTNVSAAPPNFSVDFPDVVCVTADVVKLWQYLSAPYQGVYSGAGLLEDSIFIPALAGVGAHPITCTVFFQNCPFSITDTIYVVEPGVASMTDIPNFCLYEPRFLLNVGSPAGGVYSGIGVEFGFFTPSAAGVGAHVVTYSVELGEFCIAETSQIVNVIPSPTKPVITAEPPIFALCDGDSITLTSSFYPNYGWSTGEVEQSIVVSAAGSYFVAVRNGAGCFNYSDTISLSLSTRPAIDTLFSPLYSNGFNLSSYTSNDGSIELEVSGGSLPYTYTWSNGDTSEDLANLSSGEYTLVIADSAGCPVTGSITLTRPNSPPVPNPNPNPGTTEFSLPNAFTPNGDGFNDAYRINSLLPDYALNKFMVWDISRRLVFSAENYDNTWTGLDNSGKKLPAGTYFAVFESSKLTEPVKTYIDLRYE